MASPILLVIFTASSQKEAVKISQAILNKRLAACVNLIPSVTSCYWWKGRQEKSREVLLLIKTQKSAFKKLEKTIRECHSYEVPEVIGLPITAASRPYLNWMLKEIDMRRKAMI